MISCLTNTGRQCGKTPGIVPVARALIELCDTPEQTTQWTSVLIGGPETLGFLRGQKVHGLRGLVAEEGLHTSHAVHVSQARFVFDGPGVGDPDTEVPGCYTSHQLEHVGRSCRGELVIGLER